MIKNTRTSSKRQSVSPAQQRVLDQMIDRDVRIVRRQGKYTIRGAAINSRTFKSLLAKKLIFCTYSNVTETGISGLYAREAKQNTMTAILAKSSTLIIPAAPCECAVAVIVAASLDTLWAAANDAASAADARTNDPSQKLYIAQMLETVQYIARTASYDAKRAMLETLIAACERIGA